MPVAERQQETGTHVAGPPLAILDNWPDTGLVPGPERALTRSGEPVTETMTKDPEPMGKPAPRWW